MDLGSEFLKRAHWLLLVSLSGHDEVGENCKLDLTAVPGINPQGEVEALLIGAVRNRKLSESEQEAAAPFPSSNPAVSL